MDTEEKARRYDEALEKMRKMLKSWSELSYNGKTFLQDLKHIFPELAESDDERVRKSIIHILQVGGYMSPEEKDKAFAYLEKQKEQKPLTTEETELNSIAFLEQMGYTCIPPRKEQKPAEKQDYSGLNDFERAILRGFLSAGVENVPVTIIKETAKECLARMKPAEWNEEDENIYNKALDAIYYKDCNEKDDVISALNDLCGLISRKRKVIPPYARWKPSDDDKQYFDNLVVMFEKSLRSNRCYFTSYDVDWLKSKFNGNSCK